MADLKKCDRCFKTVDPNATRKAYGWRPEQWSWSDLEIEFKADVNRKIARELCEDCTKLLIEFLKPNAVPPPVRPLPLDGSGETVRQVFQNVPAVDPKLTALLAEPAVPDPLDVVMAVAEELKEPDLMILPPGPPIHIPRGATITNDYRPRCLGQPERGQTCGHLTASHGDSGCMVKINGEFCPCTKALNDSKHDYSFAAQSENVGENRLNVPEPA